jgi:DNA helicase-2/ATP-dependent DNA helicase PcrA
MITALTFTNKAAEEMRERLVALCGRLRQGRVDLHLPRARRRDRAREMPRGEAFVVYDQADTAGWCASSCGRPRRPTEALRRRGHPRAHLHAKNAMLTPEELEPRRSPDNEYDEIAAWVFPRYEAALRRLRALDFDDLILWPLRHLTEDASSCASRGAARSATCSSTSFKTPTARSCCW